MRKSVGCTPPAPDSVSEPSGNGQPDLGGSPGCPFCELPAAQVIAGNHGAVSFLDRFPLSRGHALVIPRRHVESLFELEKDEFSSVWTLVAEVRERLRGEMAPDGFTVGVNDGPAAGQTIAHAHVHVIPRHYGDVPDSRGGIRWVIPARAPYWIHDE